MSSDPQPDPRAGAAAGGAPDERGIVIRLEQVLLDRAMTMTELSARTGITMANLSVLKTNKAKAIRMSTLAALCRALDITPGDLLALPEDAHDPVPPPISREATSVEFAGETAGAVS